MTWHDRGQEQPAEPRLLEPVIAALWFWAYVVWAASVGLAR